MGQKKKARKHKLYLPVIIIGNVKPWFLIYVPLLASAHPSVTGLCVALFNAHSDGTPEKRCEMSTYVEDNAINIMSLLPWGWSKDHRPGAQWPHCQVILVPLLLGWNCCHLQDQPLFPSHSQVWLHFLSQNLWTCSDFFHIAAECFTLLCALITSELQKQTDSMFSEQFQEFLDSCCSLPGQLCILGSIHYDCRLLFSPLTDKPHVSLGDCSAWWRNSPVCGGVWQPWIRPLLCFDCLICQSLILLTCTAWFTAFVALTHWDGKMKGASLTDAGPSGSDARAWQWSHLEEPLANILLLIIKLYKRNSVHYMIYKFLVLPWASVTLCARKIRNSWCSCPCCSRHFKITWRTWDPTIIMSTRWSCCRACLHQNMHAPPGKATLQHKSQERSSTNTEITKLILFKHQWTNAARCQRGVWGWGRLTDFDWT